MSPSHNTDLALMQRGKSVVPTGLYFSQKSTLAQDLGTETCPVKGLHCAF